MTNVVSALSIHAPLIIFAAPECNTRLLTGAMNFRFRARNWAETRPRESTRNYACISASRRVKYVFTVILFLRAVLLFLSRLLCRPRGITSEKAPQPRETCRAAGARPTVREHCSLRLSFSLVPLRVPCGSSWFDRTRHPASSR